MKPSLKSSTKTAFLKFIKAYPRPLTRHVTMICDPVLVGYYDFSIGEKGDDSTRVAYYRDDGGDRPGAKGAYDYHIARKIPPATRGYEPLPYTVMDENNAQAIKESAERVLKYIKTPCAVCKVVRGMHDKKADHTFREPQS